MAKEQERRITVRMLKEHLNSYKDDAELYFGGLEFYRLKNRSSDGLLVQVEFSQQVYRDKDGNVVIENLD